MISERQRICELAALAIRAGVLRKLVLSAPLEKEAPLRQSGKLVMHRERRIFLLETQYEGGRVSQKLIEPENAEAELAPLIPLYGQVNLLTSEGDAELRVNRKGHAHLVGDTKLGARLGGEEAPTVALDILPLENKKNYILQGDEPFLVALGVSDAKGRVHDKKRAKFRQINRFLEHLADVYGELPKEGPLLVYDLCCGKSYLSFAVYHYLSHLCGREVRMVCVDLKRDVIEYCDGVAKVAGLDGMEFICGDVRYAVPAKQPDLVVSLHACDIATDIVLRRAVELSAKVILATPCCHRHLSERLDCPALDFVTSEPQLRGKLAEALTDGLRLLRLSREGYSASAVELTDPDDTPKNTLLRAVLRKKSPAAREAADRRYREALAFLLGRDANDFPEEL